MSIFSSVPDSYKVKLSKFNLSKEVLTTADYGKLYPVYCRVFLPNSYVKIEPNAVIKTAPMFAPIYSSFIVTFHAFAVPLRILWRDFYDWVYNPEDSENLPPHVNEKQFVDSLLQYSDINHTLASDFGFPDINNFDTDTIDENAALSIFHFLAYHKIYYEFFRNENIQDAQDVASFLEDDELQDYTSFLLSNPELFFDQHFVNYRKDYFTSALPTAQKGTQAFLSVLGSLQAPVNIEYRDTKNFPQVLGGDPAPANTPAGFTSMDSNMPATMFGTWTGVQAIGANNSARVYADLQQAAAGLSASDFRSLFAVQSYLEQLNVGGSRYIEGTLSFFNTRVRDSRAQRPEFLGSMSTVVSPKEVVANMPNNIGTLGALGQGAATGSTFRYWSSEHFMIMITMSIRTNAQYFQGLSKEWRLLDQFDFPIPLFQHLGEEPIKNEELFYSSNSSVDKDTFGYQSRFAYWRSERSQIGGDFRTSLDSWHTARIFSSKPSLSEDFIRTDPSDISRIFNYTGKASDHFWCSLFFKISAKLPLRYHSKPMLIG